MKYFYYIILLIIIFLLGSFFYQGGISERNSKFIDETILLNKTNDLSGNQDPTFISQMFALNNLVFKEDKIANIIFDDILTIGNENKQVYLVIDIYQTMPLAHTELDYLFHGIISEFRINNLLNNPLQITGHYENDLGNGKNRTTYNLTNYDFPLFGINDTFTNNEINKLETVIFSYQGTHILELDITKTLNITPSYKLKDFSGYPEDLNSFKDFLKETLSIGYVGYQIPNLDELNLLNENGFNFYVFSGQEAYDYFIYIYMGIYLVIVLIIIYFSIIRKRLKKKII